MPSKHPILSKFVGLLWVLAALSLLAQAVHSGGRLFVLPGLRTHFYDIGATLLWFSIPWALYLAMTRFTGPQRPAALKGVAVALSLFLMVCFPSAFDHEFWSKASLAQPADSASALDPAETPEHHMGTLGYSPLWDWDVFASFHRPDDNPYGFRDVYQGNLVWGKRLRYSQKADSTDTGTPYECLSEVTYHLLGFYWLDYRDPHRVAATSPRVTPDLSHPAPTHEGEATQP